MPAKSKAELRKLFSISPALGKEFADATPSISALPEYAGKGRALVRASKRRRRPRTALSQPPVARGGTVTGASTSTTRVGY